MSTKTSVGVSLNKKIVEFFEDEASKGGISFNKKITDELSKIVDFLDFAELIHVIKEEAKNPLFEESKDQSVVRAIYMDDDLIYSIDKMARILQMKRSIFIRTALSYSLRKEKEKKRKQLIGLGVRKTLVSKMEDCKDYEIKGDPAYYHEKVIFRKEGTRLYSTSVGAVGAEFDPPQTVWFEMEVIPKLEGCEEIEIENLDFGVLEHAAFEVYEIVMSGKRPKEWEGKMGVYGVDATGSRWEV